MLKLNLSNEPAWLDLGYGVRVLLEPLTTVMMLAAHSDPTVRALSEDAADEDLTLALAKVIARNTVIDWEGVGDANGNAISVSPEAIGALLDVWPLFEAFQTQYLSKGLALDQEKNDSAPLPTGSSAGVGNTAQPAAERVKPARKN